MCVCVIRDECSAVLARMIVLMVFHSVMIVIIVMMVVLMVTMCCSALHTVHNKDGNDDNGCSLALDVLDQKG